MEKLKVSYESQEGERSAQQLAAVRVEDVKSLEEGVASAISLVWADGGVQQCYQRRREYQLSDSAK